jgi:hypothetical protein
MYAEVDPRIALLNDLRAAQWSVPVPLQQREPHPRAARGTAQWPGWLSLATLLVQFVVAAALVAISIRMGRMGLW